ncbi:DAK2 domain-containing protein [Nonomuraea dietziae]|uniref:DAK2 domain-containing protein n=1 Tax=Nonomuraea dietziae TaxID=65515 RepID=UPI003CD08E82
MYGSLFRQLGKSLGDAPEVSLDDLAAAFATGLESVTRLGKAAEGGQDDGRRARPPRRARCRRPPARDSSQARRSAGRRPPRPRAPRRRSRCRPRKGRASYLGPRSVGHEDPGAASAALILSALHP